jgi:alpha-galactosidase
VNLDEGWQGLRAADGSITGTKKQGFEDMKALGDYIHSKGLKFGIYSSPGPICCSGRLGSRDHEQQDADTWASWGVDYLKYDRCADDGKRWKLMRACLDNTGRDIVYSTGSCRDPEVKAQLWRTTGDIRNNWQSLSSIGFIQQAGLEKLAGPGRYNDPDMLIVGDPADLRRGSGITRNEQITHLTLWSMLAAPMLLGCDLTKADDFLVSVTCNDDVLDVNQDPLVRQGTCFRKDPAMGASDMGGEVWTRPLFDGTQAVAFFNRGSEPVEIAVTWKELGLTGPQPVRDCWLRKDLGSFDTGFSVSVEVHAAVLLKVGKPTTDRYEPVSR